MYYVGYSNGAIFSSHVAQKFGNVLFKGICNMMVGFGKYNKEVEIYKDKLNPVSMLFFDRRSG